MANDMLRVQLASFNVGQHISSDTLPDLTSWLVPTNTDEGKSGYASQERHGTREAPDLYAIGFQEFALLPNALAGWTETLRATIDREIRRTIRLHQSIVRPDHMYDPIEHGGGPENYSQVAEIAHGGMLLLVYARERRSQRHPHLPSAAERVKEVRMSSVGSGIFQLMGNKGAVGVRIVLASLSPGAQDDVYTFLCPHLAAHEHNVERRNLDWKNVVERLVFAADRLGYAPRLQPISKTRSEKETMNHVQSIPTKPAAQNQTPALDQNEYSVYDTHHLFVLGDLNYRVGSNVAGAPPSGGATSPVTYPPMRTADIKMLARSNNPRRWAWLLPYDQLTLQHATTPPRAFQSLHIPDLSKWNLAPTYKYKVNASTKSSDVLSFKRLPGWPDRILWSQKDEIHCELYRSVMAMRVSDHKPITTILNVPEQGPKQFLSRPFAIDPSWRAWQTRGLWMDRTLAAGRS
ncbi:hypothetical protein MYAM1_000991 [Malassezia yamatoensis]|uniref:Inositol polyphosphate-related phosphatase domain-containing protein n=1 Tax=Malassezia yamatoensis TaxID=253288 RepID=A0AAJ5YQN3_9BASI|nr:hypothetical protein MYAM1_000991 [Malassezia yamatoensis]